MLWPQDSWGLGLCVHAAVGAGPTWPWLVCRGLLCSQRLAQPTCPQAVASAAVPLDCIKDSMNQEEMGRWEEASCPQNVSELWFRQHLSGGVIIPLNVVVTLPDQDGCPKPSELRPPPAVSHVHPLSCPAGHWCYPPTPQQEKGVLGHLGLKQLMCSQSLSP